MSTWHRVTELPPEKRALCVDWVNRRLNLLAQCGNSPRPDADWAARVVDACRVQISYTGDVVNMEPLESVPGHHVSLFSPTYQP